MHAPSELHADCVVASFAEAGANIQRWAKVPPYVPMWVLFDGICHAFPTILASTIFVVIVIAIFAGLLISLLHEDQGIMTDPVLAELALLSLVQFLSGDGLADMYYTLMLARPELSLIFIPLFVLVTIGLMNLVPAILFENQAREKEYKQIIGQQRFQKEKVFTADGVTEVSNGWLSTADFAEKFGAFKLDELFAVLVRKLCPGDPDPILPVDEFLEAVMELLILEVPLSTMETLTAWTASCNCSTYCFACFSLLINLSIHYWRGIYYATIW